MIWKNVLFVWRRCIKNVSNHRWLRRRWIKWEPNTRKCSTSNISKLYLKDRNEKIYLQPLDGPGLAGQDGEHQEHLRGLHAADHGSCVTAHICSVYTIFFRFSWDIFPHSAPLRAVATTRLALPSSARRPVPGHTGAAAGPGRRHLPS